jgi:hypothetical protein
MVAPTADSGSVKSASHFSDLAINFKCKWSRAYNFFIRRGRGATRRLPRLGDPQGRPGMKRMVAVIGLGCCSLIAGMR